MTESNAQDRSWTLQRIHDELAREFASARAQWSDQFALVDQTIAMLAAVRWRDLPIEPELDHEAAEFARESERAAREPGEDAAAVRAALEARFPRLGQRQALELALATVVREYATSCTFAAHGLRNDAIACMRRLAEALFDVHLLLSDSALGWTYFSADTQRWWSCRRDAITDLRRRARGKAKPAILLPFEDHFLNIYVEPLHAGAHAGIAHAAFNYAGRTRAGSETVIQWAFTDHDSTFCRHLMTRASEWVWESVHWLAPEHPWMDRAAFERELEAVHPLLARAVAAMHHEVKVIGTREEAAGT